MRKNKMNLVIIILSIAIMIAFIATGDFKGSLHVIATSSPIWIACAFLCIVLYWLFETLTVHVMTVKLHKGQKFSNTFKTTMLGQFFNCTTPFATGGQPMQAYHMSTYGVSVGVATSALIARFIVYQTVLTLYATVMLIINFGYFQSNISGFSVLVIIGFIVNVAVVIFLYSVSIFKKGTRRFFRFIFITLHKLRLVKNLEKRLEQIDEEIEKFYQNFKLIRQYKKTLVWMFLLSFLQLTAYFIIPYFIGLAFGLTQNNLFLMISAQGFVLMIASFFPLPGAMGASEFSFVQFFNLFFQQAGQVQTAMLVWRFITFYLPIIVGSFFSLKINKKTPPASENKESLPEASQV